MMLDLFPYDSLFLVSPDIDSSFFIQEIHEHLDFSVDGDRDSFNIFSIKFSTDGRELVAGGSDDSIYVYDLEANKLAMRLIAHTV